MLGKFITLEFMRHPFLASLFSHGFIMPEMNFRIMQFIKCFDYFCFNYAPVDVVSKTLSCPFKVTKKGVLLM